MNERQKRLKEVYEHLRKFYGIHTQSDFANALRKSRNAITLALNGDEKYLTDKLFTTICETYKGVFDLDYLLTGKGTLLADKEEKQSTPTVQEPAADLLELYAQRIRLVDDLRTSLKEEIAEVRALRSELQQARDDFRDATYRMTQFMRNMSESRQTQSRLGIAAEDINEPKNP